MFRCINCMRHTALQGVKGIHQQGNLIRHGFRIHFEGFLLIIEQLNPGMGMGSLGRDSEQFTREHIRCRIESGYV
ncbi:hypothetical protein D3C81_2140790 [compost metagenome]